jgi:hypothetical protein
MLPMSRVFPTEMPYPVRADELFRPTIPLRDAFCHMTIRYMTMCMYLILYKRNVPRKLCTRKSTDNCQVPRHCSQYYTTKHLPVRTIRKVRLACMPQDAPLYLMKSRHAGYATWTTGVRFAKDITVGA